MGDDPAPLGEGQGDEGGPGDCGEELFEVTGGGAPDPPPPVVAGSVRGAVGEATWAALLLLLVLLAVGARRQDEESSAGADMAGGGGAAAGGTTSCTRTPQGSITALHHAAKASRCTPQHPSRDTPATTLPLHHTNTTPPPRNLPPPPRPPPPALLHPRTRHRQRTRTLSSTSHSRPDTVYTKKSTIRRRCKQQHTCEAPARLLHTRAQ